MKPVSRFVLGFSSCAFLAACFSQVQQPVAASTAVVFAGQVASNNAALPLVNLPDFSALVERAGPAVVNIEASVKEAPSRKNASAGSSEMPPGADEMPELFKRFFGQPGMPMPQPPRSGTAYGSGFVISSDGYVLTNHHVVADADEVIVRLADRRELKAKVIGSDEMSDVALLKVEANNLPVLQIADSKKVKPVALPPGRARLSTRPRPTGSVTATNMRGIECVSRRSATRPGAAPAIITSGFISTSSFAEDRARSGSPAYQRYSLWILRPSIQPNRLRPF